VIGKMKKLFLVTDKEGKQVISVLRTIIGGLTTLLLGAAFTHAVWVHNQAYTVAINKASISKTAEQLERKTGINAQDIIMNHGEHEDRMDRMEEKTTARFDRNNGILHGRITKVDDKYDAKLTELQKLLMETNKLVVEMLIQKNKDVQLQKKEIEIQQKILKENGHNK